MTHLSQDKIHTIVSNSNKFWDTMYYDSVELLPYAEVSLLKNADRDYYNAAHNVTTLSPQQLFEIEEIFRQRVILPAFYEDPYLDSSTSELLSLHQYSYLPEEDEHWYGYDLTSSSIKSPALNLEDFSVKVTTPQESPTFEDFLTVNAESNNLPSHLINRLKSGLRANKHNIRLYLFVAYVGKTPVATKATGIVNAMAFNAEGATLPAYRRLGISSVLSSKACSLALSNGAREIYTNCDKHAWSNNVYQRIGFNKLFTRRLFRKTQ